MHTLCNLWIAFGHVEANNDRFLEMTFPSNWVKTVLHRRIRAQRRSLDLLGRDLEYLQPPNLGIGKPAVKKPTLASAPKERGCIHMKLYHICYFQVLLSRGVCFISIFLDHILFPTISTSYLIDLNKKIFDGMLDDV